MHAKGPIDEAPARQRRAWPRYALAGGLAVSLTADGRRWDCVLEDVSPGGARVRLDRPPPRNLELRVEWPPAGTAYGARTWAAAGRMGIRFDRCAGGLGLITHCLTCAEVRPTAAGPVPRAPNSR